LPARRRLGEGWASTPGFQVAQKDPNPPFHIRILRGEFAIPKLGRGLRAALSIAHGLGCVQKRCSNLAGSVSSKATLGRSKTLPYSQSDESEKIVAPLMASR
jgi:hypothetical protein